MSKIRPVRQRTDAPQQDEGPSPGAALLAGAVLGLVTDAVVLALPRQQAGPAPGEKAIIRSTTCRKASWPRCTN